MRGIKGEELTIPNLLHKAGDKVSYTVSITTLCENSVGSRGLLGEHGLALLLEFQDQKILFDTGAGLTLLHNAEALGIELGDLDAVVLSHGHHDHTGGLASLADRVGSLPVYAHPEVFGAKYRKDNPDKYRYNGIPWSREELKQRGLIFRLNQSWTELGPEILLTGEIPRLEQPQDENHKFYTKTDEGFIKDYINDDQAVIINAPEKVIVVLGCAHAGLFNTLQYALKLTGAKSIYAMLGGTHLLHFSYSRLYSISERLQHFGLQELAPCHCTGRIAQFALYQVFGESMLENRVGSTFTL